MEGSLTKRPESSLIGSSTTGSSPSILLYFFVKFLPFLGYFAAFSVPDSPKLAVICFTLPLAFSFWLVKFRFGWSLVGIKWDVKSGSIAFQSTPSPSCLYSFAFWAGFAASLCLWVAAFFASIAKGRISLHIFSIVGLAVEWLHCQIFVRGRRTVDTDAAHAQRAEILDDSIRFAIIKEHKGDSDDGGKTGRSQSDVV
jgi:hypothetical protein